MADAKPEPPAAAESEKAVPADKAEAPAPKETEEKKEEESDKNTINKIKRGGKNPLFFAKSKTGFVGLVNQTNTCYLNSLLQCLYLTPDFRSKLFDWTYKESHGTAERCIPLQLQLLFARLKLTKRGAIQTKDLTHSFYWDSGEAFQQHDVQELLRVLLEKTAQTFAKDGEKNPMDLFDGQMEDYLECQVCKTSRARVDKFQDLSIPIKNMKGETYDTLEAAIEQYVKPELLCGDNQYNCEKCGKKVDAKKGLRFKKLPPLLFVQLMRFVFDWQTMKRNKLYHKCEYPKELDLSKFMGKPEGTHVYELYGVIVHMGTAGGGHYVCYAQELETNLWYTFNDAMVSEMTEAEFNKAKGGKDHSSTGYVLLYRDKNAEMPKKEGLRAETIERIQKEDAVFEAEHQALLKEMRSITVRFHCRNRQIPIKLDTKEVTFAQMKAQVIKTFELENVDGKDIRFRRFDTKLKFIGSVLEIEEEKSLMDSGFKHDCDLVVETREPDQPWKEVDPDEILVRVLALDKATCERFIVDDLNCYKLENYNILDTFQDVISLTVNKNKTFAHLAEEYAKVAKANNKEVDPKCVRAMRIQGNQKICFMAPDAEIVNRGVTLGSVVLIQVAESAEAEAPFLKEWEEARLKIAISFNTPSKEADSKTRVDWSNKMRVSKVLTIAEFKAIVAKKLDLDPDTFRLRKSTRGAELKNYDKTLEDSGVKEGSVVFVEYGTPAKPGEISINFKLYDPSKHLTGARKFAELIQHPFPKNYKIGELKKALVKVLNEKLSENERKRLNIEHVRLRKFKGSMIKDILYDANTLRMYHFSDNSNLAVQLVKAPEVFTKQSIVLFFQRYRADVLPHGKLEKERVELVLKKSAKLSALKTLISAQFDIETENVLVYPGRITRVMKAVDVHKLDWEHMNNTASDDNAINAAPMGFRNGMICIFRDKSVVMSEAQLKQLEDERRAKDERRRQKLKGNPNFKAGSKTTSYRKPRKEVALVIRTEDEMKEIEAKQAAEKEAREQRVAEAQAKIDENADKPAAVNPEDQPALGKKSDPKTDSVEDKPAAP